MGKQISYSHVENEVRPHFRNNLNLAESSEDVKKIFVYAVQDVIDKALEGKVPVNYGEVELSGDVKHPFIIHQRLLHDLAFMNAWYNSDLPKIFGDFAETAVKHMKHFGKMPDKTEAKIFSTPSHAGHSHKKSPGSRN